MDSTGIARGLLKAIADSPFMVKAIVVFGLGSWGWKWWKDREEKLLVQDAMGWPLQKARVVAAQVIEEQRGEDGPTLWAGLLTYSYMVNETEIGEYRSFFSSEEQAEAWAVSLRGGSVMVHVDPQNPSRSRWTADESNLTRVAAFTMMKDASPKPLSGGFQIARWCTIIVSAIGAVISFCVQVAILGGICQPDQVLGGAWFSAMHVAAIACGISSGILVWKRYPRRGVEAVIESLADTKTRTGLKLIGWYATALFLACWMQGFFGVHLLLQLGTDLAFAAIWLMVFATSTVVSWVIAKPQGSASELAPSSRD